MEKYVVRQGKPIYTPDCITSLLPDEIFVLAVICEDSTVAVPHVWLTVNLEPYGGAV